MLHVVALGEDIDLFASLGVYIAQGDLVAQRCTRCGVTGDFDAVGTEHLAGTGDATFAAAGTHTHAGDVFQFVDRDVFAVAHDGQQLFLGDVLAVAHIGLALDRVERLHDQRLGIAVLGDKAFDVGQCVGLQLADADAGHIGLVVFLEHFLYLALADAMAVVVH